MKTRSDVIPDFDWNFDNVPDSKLVACCYWEYARESAFILETLRRYRGKWHCGGGELDDSIRKLWNDVGMIQSIGHEAEVFVRGCVFEPGSVWQSHDPERPNYRHPDATPVTGHFPASWQSLSKTEREYRAHLRSDVEQLGIVPIKLAHWSWAKEIARECQHAADEHHEQRKAWEHQYIRRDAKGNYFPTTNAPAVPEFEPIRPRTRWGVGETLMVDIAWDCFTNDELVTCFRQWVKAARPKEIHAPSQRGHKPRDWRANLTRLAVMRLLARFTALQLVDGRQDSFPAIWDTKQFAARKWADVTKWHDARREARKLFHTLFPFLPAEANPISWERQRPAK